jgi:SPP1 gp7 family putative phage head morphogenesis protein
MPDLSAVFRLPPKEAVAWFEAKGYRITWDWHDMLDEAHAQAFTVAKAARLDILTDLRGGLAQALKEGQTERWFIQTLTPILQKKGWWGKAYDPETGEVLFDAKGRRIRQGSPRRLSTIYRTNLQSAYMAGRWKAAEAAKASHPYLQYVAVMDSRTRPTHADMNGRVFAVDDPIWHTHYPPNGYNCRCRTRPLSRRALEREGLAPSSSAGRLTEVERPVSLRDPEAGSTTVTVYKGPDMARGFAPDVGFNSNPGRAQALWDRNGLLPDCDGTAAFAAGGPCNRIASGQKNWRDMGRPDLRKVPAALFQAHAALPDAAVNRADALSMVLSATGLEVVPLRIVRTPIEEVALRPEYLAYIAKGEAGDRERFAGLIVPTLETPYEIWTTAYEDNSLRRHYIGLFMDEAKRGLFVAVRLNLDGSLLWNAVPMSDLRKLNAERVGGLDWAR